MTLGQSLSQLNLLHRVGCEGKMGRGGTNICYLVLLGRRAGNGILPALAFTDRLIQGGPRFKSLLNHESNCETVTLMAKDNVKGRENQVHSITRS